MKNLLITFILIPMLVVSCNQEENRSAPKPIDIYSLDFSAIEGTSSFNQITAKLTTTAGEEIKDVSQLQPNSIYNLVVKGPADFYRIKSSDGFEVVNNPSLTKSTSENFIFTIKTTKEVGELYANIVPLNISGEKVYRERPQVFLLPE